MNKYNIVNNEIELRKFIEWLPSIDIILNFIILLSCAERNMEGPPIWYYRTIYVVKKI